MRDRESHHAAAMGPLLEKRWEDKIVQLALGSVDGTVSAAELRIWLSAQGEMDKKWSDRSEKEDKIAMND